MCRIAVIGPPGSGKSTFSQILGGRAGIEHYNLDDYLFDEGGRQVDRQNFRNMHDRLIRLDKWIIDGISIDTIEERLDVSDVVILLDFSFLTFFLGVASRGLRRAFGDRRSLPAKVRGDRSYRWRPSWHNLRRLVCFRYREWPVIEKAVAARPRLVVHRFRSRGALKHGLPRLLRELSARDV